MANVKLLRLSGLPILHQLKIEEALYRASSSNWFVLNDGSQNPAIVLGISGKPEELVHEKEAKEAGLQLIKRFSGGGTVIVDEDTIFAGFIVQSQDIQNLDCYPRPIMEWSREFYAPVFNPHANFGLQENDYAIDHQKFAGNAQAISKQRFVHHTSFLWDFKPGRMGLLKHPTRSPTYRAGREHLDFLCKMKDFMPSREAAIAAICNQLSCQFRVQEVSIQEAENLLEKDYLKSNKVLSQN